MVFDIEDHWNCSNDRLRIHDDGVYKDLCGSGYLNNFTSASNTVDLMFTSDFAVSYRGFRIRYFSRETGTAYI